MISIFAKHTFFLGEAGKEENWELKRVSSRIRGEEIAEYLGAKLNQERSDVNIYVKGCGHGQLKDGDYVDILDDVWTVDWLKDRPGIRVIAMSLSHLDWLKEQLKNEIVYIPHHHLNFERVRKTGKGMVTGYVGAPQNIKADIYLTNFKTRQDIIDFYKKIDIQVIGDVPDVPYYHPTKIINAMSFGIPTVAPKKMGYREVEGFYFQSIEELKNGWDAERLIKEAEKYHISKIAELYKKL
jgi:hypothetical protein